MSEVAEVEDYQSMMDGQLTVSFMYQRQDGKVLHVLAPVGYRSSRVPSSPTSPGSKPSTTNVFPA